LAQKNTPDLIILDVGLPRDEGFELLEQKRGLTDIAAIPVIVLSARDPVKNDKLVPEAGAVTTTTFFILQNISGGFAILVQSRTLPTTLIGNRIPRLG
jgi:CheY-like chemotaxis protein